MFAIVALFCEAGTTDPGECVELTEREFSVCQLICGSSEAVSFSELKSTTQIHQEVLSRIVRRLVIHRVVRKDERGRYEKALNSN